MRDEPLYKRFYNLSVGCLWPVSSYGELLWTLTGSKAINTGARYGLVVVSLPCVSAVTLEARNPPPPPYNHAARYWLPLALMRSFR